MNISAPKSLVGCSHPPTLGACGKEASQHPRPASEYEGQSAQALSHKERDDHYFAVLAMLTPRWRVILCKSGSQFILQRHFAETEHSGAWRANSFHVSRNSLMKACVTLGLLSDPKMEQLLAGLPATAHECAAVRAPK